MNLENLRTMTRLVVPGAKNNVIDDTGLTLILNQGAIDIALQSICLPVNSTFGVVAEQREYNLSSVVSDYLVPDKPGLYWYDGSNWLQLKPRTLKYFDEHYPFWRDADSGDPQMYSIDNNTLTVYPKPDTTLANGFWLYYGRKPQTMTAPSHYPFGFGSEITRLAPLSECIIAYAEWPLVKALGKDEDVVVAKEQAYKKSLAEKTILINQRPDLKADKKTK